jgi:hypothetical protein
MTMLDQMNSADLEALAAKLCEQIRQSAAQSEIAEIELQDVKSWIALRKEEAESCFELPFFVNAP